jgi:hypothetical protein
MLFTVAVPFGTATSKYAITHQTGSGAIPPKCGTYRGTHRKMVV